MDDLYWDLLAAASHLDPYGTWRKRLRDEAPVYRNEDCAFYSLSRFADVEAAHRDTSTILFGRVGEEVQLLRTQECLSAEAGSARSTTRATSSTDSNSVARTTRCRKYGGES
jgi:hypothetical protein